jgi:hypothetical protein
MEKAYKTVSGRIYPLSEEELNDLASQGWRLYFILAMPSPTHVTCLEYIFRRVVE